MKVQRKRTSQPAVAFYGKVRIPTIGHKKAIDHAKSIAKDNNGRLYVALSGTSHPLSSKSKRKHAEAVFDTPVMPESKHTSNIFHFLSHINTRHDHLHLVAGSDRVSEFEKILRRYNGKKDKQGNVPFNFKSWKVHEVPGRRINSRIDARKMSQKEKEQSVSASKLESLAHEGQYEQFKAYHPGLPDRHVRSVYNEIRSAGKIDESVSHKEFAPMLDSFTDFASKHLGIKSLPNIKLKKDEKELTSTFGGYNPTKQEIILHTKNRHPMDALRTLAHELTHHKQYEDNELKHVEKDGSDGSDIENTANARAGVIMREFGRKNPNYFDLGHIKEAVFVVGGPCSGKDKYIKHLVKEMNADELDIQSVINGDYSNDVVINAPANNLKSIEESNNCLKNKGYKTSLIFVEVTNEISKKRNEERLKKGQRMLKESIRLAKFTEANNNKEKFKKMFEEKMSTIDNSITETKGPCWKGYEMVGMKKKDGRKVPNCVPVKEDKKNYDYNNAFNAYMEEHGAGDEGTRKVVKRYLDDTPGQVNKKETKKVLTKEDGILDTASGAVGLPLGGGIGAMYGTAKSPSIISGLAGDAAPSGGPSSLYPFGTYGFAESVNNWLKKPETLDRFKKKYGELAEQKLFEMATNLSKSVKNNINVKPKSIRSLRECRYPSTWSSGGTDAAPPIGASSKLKDGEVYQEDKWSDKKYQNPEGGLTKAGVMKYRKENPGSKLQTAVREKPSKLKKGSKRWKRRKSFCSRMKGMKAKLTSAKTARDPDSRINKSLRAWNCEE